MPLEGCQKCAKRLVSLPMKPPWILSLPEMLDLQGMATRNGSSASIHLQEAMALLIRNQAAFVEQISRNDQERLALQRQTDEWQRKSDERFA